MRYSSILMVTTLAILLTVAAGCTSTPSNGSLTSATETTAQSAPVVTTAIPVSTSAVPATTGTKCQSGQTSCADGTCRDTTSDHDACGGCGNVCPAGYICKASSCINPVPATGTTVVTQDVSSKTTNQANPVTFGVTTAPTLIATYEHSVAGGNNLQFSTLPPTTKVIDCAQYPLSITSISPSSGPKTGTPIVIHGSGFKNGAYTRLFATFNDKAVPLDPTSDSVVSLTTPVSPTTGPVDVQIVAAFGQNTNPCPSPVTSASRFTYT